MGETYLELVRIDLQTEKMACFKFGSGTMPVMALDEIEKSIHQLQMAKSLILLAGNQPKCQECILDGIEKVGQA